MRFARPPMIESFRLHVGDSAGAVSAMLLRPEGARWLLVFGHGAGAGIRHPFMDGIAQRLAARRIATFRYQFPYMERGGGRPDPQPVLLATLRSAFDRAARTAPDLPLLAGGKSLGGRMTSIAAAKGEPAGVRGLVFFGFPLHPAGQPSTHRADHLGDVPVPMLFLQGTRDALADLALLRPCCERLGDRATLHIVDGADHSFHVPKRSGKTVDQVFDELVEVTAAWAGRIL